MIKLFFAVLATSLLISPTLAAPNPPAPISENGRIGTFRYEQEKDLNRGRLIQKQEEQERPKRSFDRDVEEASIQKRKNDRRQ